MMLRPGTADDAAAIADLIASFQPELTDQPDGAGADEYLASVSSQAERGYLESHRYAYIVAEQEGSLLGLIALRDVSHIFHLFVAREHQREGLARHLWHEAKAQAFKDAAPTQFTVNSSLLAVPVYRSFGFEPAGEVVSAHGISFLPMRLTALEANSQPHGRQGASPRAVRRSARTLAGMELLGPQLRLESQCEAVLRSLPQWFGIEEALRMYVADTARLPTFALSEGGAVVAFISLMQHFRESWEIHCMAVHSNARNRGHGTALLTHAEHWLLGQDVKFLQVKTVAHTSNSLAYAQTREFYRAKGFTPLEIFPLLWAPQNPALQLIKVLHRAWPDR